MALEAGTYISDFIATNPLGSDDRSTADDHIRLIKDFILATFPNITEAMTANHTELNIIDGLTGSTEDLNLLTGAVIAGLTAADLTVLTGAAAGGLTATELLYLINVTSDIQTQLDAKMVGSNNLSELTNTITARNNLGLFVRPSALVDFGSGDDGAVTISSDTDLPPGEYHYTSLTIDSGITLGVSGVGGLVIRCTGKVTIIGTISADSKGGNGGSAVPDVAGAVGVAGNLGGSGGSGGADGYDSGKGGDVVVRYLTLSGGAAKTGLGPGNAGSSLAAETRALRLFSSFDNALIAGLYGGGGGGAGTGQSNPGNGGDGGGYIIIIADEIDFQSGAVVTGNGSNGANSANDGGGGGGGGGFILLAAATMTNDGTITTTNGSGGSGIAGYTGGDGGDGYSTVITL